MAKVKVCDVVVTVREVDVPDVCPKCGGELYRNNAYGFEKFTVDGACCDALTIRVECWDCGEFFAAGKVEILERCPWATPDRRCKLFGPEGLHDGPHELPPEPKEPSWYDEQDDCVHTIGSCEVCTPSSEQDEKE